MGMNKKSALTLGIGGWGWGQLKQIFKNECAGTIFQNKGYIYRTKFTHWNKIFKTIHLFLISCLSGVFFVAVFINAHPSMTISEEN